jgi:hypothetical protein
MRCVVEDRRGRLSPHWARRDTGPVILWGDRRPRLSGPSGLGSAA